MPLRVVVRNYFFPRDVGLARWRASSRAARCNASCDRRSVGAYLFFFLLGDEFCSSCCLLEVKRTSSSRENSTALDRFLHALKRALASFARCVTLFKEAVICSIGRSITCKSRSRFKSSSRSLLRLRAAPCPAVSNRVAYDPHQFSSPVSCSRITPLIGPPQPTPCSYA